MNKNISQLGFSHILLAVLVFVVLAGGLIGYRVLQDRPAADAGTGKSNNKTVVVTDFASCTKAEGSRLQESYPEVCVTVDGKQYTNPNQKVIPENWTWYENEELQLKLAYPKQWEGEGTRVPAWSGNPLFLAVSDNNLKIERGGGDCRYIYVVSGQNWQDECSSSPSPETAAVARTDVAEAYILPMKGAFNCGTSTVAIHVKDHFIHAALNMCSPADFPDAKQPANGQLWQEDVRKDLEKVLASISPL